MTEAEWLMATFGLLLMQEADGKVRDENGSWTWRSVAARVACLKRLGLEMPERVRRWLATAEAYLDEEDHLPYAVDVLFDGQDEIEIYTAFHEAYARASPELRQRLAAAQDIFRGSNYYAAEDYLLEWDLNSPTYTGAVYEAESAVHCDIIRDIFGNPFRPIVFSPEWRTETALALTRQMHDSRNFAAMPILADALQDAGCDRDDILNHCRGLGPHVRGCWVVELILSKDRRSSSLYLS